MALEKVSVEKPIPSSISMPEQEIEEPRKRIPLATIPATICIGLLIATLYLGGRILTAHRVQKPAPAIHSALAAAPLPVPAPVIAKALPHPTPTDTKATTPVTHPATPEPQAAAREPEAATAKPEAVIAKPEAVTAKPQAVTAKPEVAATKPRQTKAAKPAVVPPPDHSDDGLPMIEPHSGERYLQVGALDPDANDTRRFVARLRKEGLDPHVAQGPTPVLMRVLIGPFTKLDALNEKKAQIESEGIDTFVREY
jgi:cell division septation protein DedD